MKRNRQRPALAAVILGLIIGASVIAADCGTANAEPVLPSSKERPNLNRWIKQIHEDWQALEYCWENILFPRQPRRPRQLIFTLEGLKELHEEIFFFWYEEMPDHMTPFRVHGGVI